MVYEYIRDVGQLMHLFDEPETKKVKPVCFGYQQRLFMLLPGYKSLAYDFLTLKQQVFAPLNFHITNTNDLKSIVLNDRDLFVFQCSKWNAKGRNQGEIFHLDLNTMARWSSIEIKTDTRPKDLISFGLLPYKRDNR